jgi:hypothetical protein
MKSNSKARAVLSKYLTDNAINGKEMGNAVAAMSFVQQANDNMLKGDYQGFLTCIKLAGEFAEAADNARWDRTEAERKVRSGVPA